MLQLPDDPRLRVILLRQAKALALQCNKIELYRPHEKQRSAHALSATYTSCAIFGGNRTGKSLAAAMEMTFHLTGRYPDWWQGRRWSRPVRAWVASESWASNIIGCQAMLMGENEAWGTGTIPRDALGPVLMQGGVSGAISTVRVKHVSGGWSVLRLRAYEQGRKKFQSASVDVIWLDEEPPWPVYTECSMRVMDARGYLLLAFTPLEGMSDVCSHFIHDEEKAGDRAYVSMSWADNPHLAPEVIAEMERKYASRPHELEARRNGVPSLGSGACYPVPDEWLLIPDFRPPLAWPHAIGGDFGWTNPTAFARLAKNPADGQVVLYGFHKAAMMPVKDHVDVIRRWEDAEGRMLKFPDKSAFNATLLDGKSVMEEYNKHGVIWEDIERRGVEGGIAGVLELMLTNRFKVCESCSLILKEKSLYARDDKGKVIKRDEFHGEHGLDAVRVAVDNIDLWQPALPARPAAPQQSSSVIDPDYGSS